MTTIPDQLQVNNNADITGTLTVRTAINCAAPGPEAFGALISTCPGG
jgi:hypothetical protein